MSTEDTANALEQQMSDLDATEWHARRKRRRRLGCLAILLLPVGMFGLLVAWLAPRFLAKPVISRDYVAEINARFDGVPESDRAWPIMKRAMIEKLTIHGKSTLSAQFPQEPNWTTWNDATAYLDALQPALDLVREAATKPVFGSTLTATEDVEYESAKANLLGYDYTPEPVSSQGPPMLLAVLLPELGEMRKWTLELSSDAILAATRNDADRAVADIVTMLHLARFCGENLTLIGQLVQIAIEGVAMSTLSRVISNCPDLLDEPQLAALDEALRTVGRSHPASDNGLTQATRSLEGERMFFDDLLQRTYSDDGEGNGRLTYEGAKFLSSGMMFSPDMTPASPFKNSLLLITSATRQELKARHTEVFDQYEDAFAERPWNRASDALDFPPFLQRSLEGGDILNRYTLLTTLMPALGSAVRAFDRIDTTRDGMIAVVALERYRLAHGEYPASLGVLVPSVLPGLPFDPVDGQPLRYVRTASGYALYSIGRDGVDDGGKPAEIAADAWPFGNRLQGSDPSGDWVLHPTMFEPQPEDMKTFLYNPDEDLGDEAFEPTDSDAADGEVDPAEVPSEPGEGRP
jgi:hypothetical protein